MKKTLNCYKTICFIMFACLCLVCILNIFLFEMVDLDSDWFIGGIYVYTMLICPFHFFSDSIAIWLSDVLVFEKCYAWLRVLVVFAFWAIILMSIISAKALRRIRYIIANILFIIDAFYHVLLVISGIHWFGGMLIAGVIATLLDIVILFFVRKVYRTELKVAMFDE